MFFDHNRLVMEFEHPIFITPEQYEEYQTIMAELNDIAEQETGDPQPKDLGYENNLFLNQKKVDQTKSNH